MTIILNETSLFKHFFFFSYPINYAFNTYLPDIGGLRPTIIWKYSRNMHKVIKICIFFFFLLVKMVKLSKKKEE